MLHHFLDSTFFSWLYPVLLVATLIAGYLIAHYRYKKKNRIWTPSGTEGPIIGFFALLLSFTFLSSNNMMRDRNVLVHKEADALAGLRRQSLLASDEYKSVTRQFLIQYINKQIAFYGTTNYADAAKVKLQIEELNGLYLSELIKLANAGPEAKANLERLYPFYNNISSSFYAITYSFEERMPFLVILLLIISSLLTSTLVGFMNGFYEAGRHVLVPLIFIVLVTFSIQAIRDIDNPLKGTVKPSIKNLEELRSSLLISQRP